MLVSAFAGRERVLRAYAERSSVRYRFFSFGDAISRRVRAMRAVVFDAPGSADVLHVGEIAVPHPGARDVLVAVEAAGCRARTSCSATVTIPRRAARPRFSGSRLPERLRRSEGW